MRKILREAFEILHTPPPQNAVQWADSNYYLSPESSSVEGKWTTYPYQKAPLLCMASDDISIVNWIKSARVGYTKLLCVLTAYFIVHRRRNGVIYQPTDSDASDFVTDEINTALRDVSVFGELLLSDPEKLSRFNKTDKKVFKGATLDIKGGKSARSFRRLTKDFVIYDELDGFDRNIDGEGSPVALGDVRVQASSFGKSIRGSTPRRAGESLMEEQIEHAHAKFERYLPCPSCGHMQVLRWANLKYDDKDSSTTRFECVKCDDYMAYHQYARMDQQGVWRTEDGLWIEDESGYFYNSAGERQPAPVSVAFHIWAAYSYYLSWSKIVDEFLRARIEQKKGNRSPMISFINTVLGETYGEDRVEADEDALKLHCEPYDGEVPSGVLHLTAGVDIQDDRFEVEICGWQSQEQSASITYKQIYGNMDRPEIWNILEELLVRTYYGPNGEAFNIKLTCIDSGGHYTSEVYDFCKRNPNQFIPTKGHSEPGKPIANFPAKKMNDHGVRLTLIGSDTAKELIYARYQIAERGPGYCRYPVNDVEYGDEYFSMATAEHYVLRYKRGHPVRVWEKQNSKRNEALDCRVGNLAAIRILSQHYGVKLDADTPPPAPPEPEKVVEEPKPETINQARRKKASRPRKGGFTQGWRK